MQCMFIKISSSYLLSRQEIFQIAGAFQQNYRVPRTIGCIDGTHIHIKAPAEGEWAYVNRKGRHSLNVQVRVLAEACIGPCMLGE